MRLSTDDATELELALLRRGMDQRAAHSERCGRCRRTPLIGERIYDYAPEGVLCELCRGVEGRPPVGSHIIHGPEFGHTMRIAARRAA